LTINAVGTTGTAQLGYNLTADLNNGTPNSNTVDYTIPTTPAYSFGAGAGSGSLGANVAVIDDTLIEGSETFTFAYTNVVAGGNMGTQITSNGANSTHALTITDNDSAAITFQSGSSAATEGGATASVVAVLTLTANGNPGSGTLQNQVTVDLTGPSIGAEYTG